MKEINLKEKLSSELIKSTKPLKPKLKESEFCIAKFLRRNKKSVFMLRTDKWITYLLSESSRKAKKDFYKLYPNKKILSIKKTSHDK